MAASATSTGPIGIEQINTTFYVWGAGGVGYDTIQHAVDSVRTLYGGGEIVIVHGHSYGEDISAVTGGTIGINILDDRDAANQRYGWNGTQFVPVDFIQKSGFVAHGMPAEPPASILMGYAPAGDLGNGSGNIVVTANPGEGMPSLNLTLVPNDGTGLFTFLRSALDPAGNPRNQSTTLEVYSSPLYPNIFNMWIGQTPDVATNKGMYIWARPTEDAIDFQGETANGTYDQDIRLNYLGGSVWLGANARVDANGALIAGATILESVTAAQADFDDCNVGDSPVRTFANTADGPSQGMIWPTFGIPVSEGDHWQDPSIDPASLATWPPVGVAVSTGTAWGPSIEANTIPRNNTANTFTGANTFAVVTVLQAFSATMNNSVLPPVVSPSAGGFALGWNSWQSFGETDFINSRGGGGGGFNWYNVGGGTQITPTLQPNMWLDSSNILHTIGGFSATSSLTVSLDSVTAPNPNGRIAVINTNSTTLRGGFQIEGFSSDFSRTIQWLDCWEDGTGVHASFPNTSLSVNGWISAPFYIANGTFGTTWADASVFIDFLTAANEARFWSKSNDNSIGSISFAGSSNSVTARFIEYLTIREAGAAFSIPVTTTALSINNPAAGTSASILSLQPGIVAGASTNLFIGQSNSVGNAAYYGFFYQAAASASNHGTIGIVGSGAVATFDAAGNWSIPQLNVANGRLRIYDRGLGPGAGMPPNINSDGNSVIINSSSAAYVYLNWDQGIGVIFGNGVGAQVAQVDTAGNAHFNGTITAGVKSFVIPHPLDPERDLVHSCIEGPEIAVYYRGESATSNGLATITLPDYFEALTRKQGRTVQLTELYDDENDPMFGNFLAAGRINDGKFNVRTSSTVAVKFYWEVKAIRSDQPTLETKKERRVAQRPADPDDAGTNGTGTPEAGEPQPEEIRPRDAATANNRRTRKSSKVA